MKIEVIVNHRVPSEKVYVSLIASRMEVDVEDGEVAMTAPATLQELRDAITALQEAADEMDRQRNARIAATTGTLASPAVYLPLAGGAR